jgi:hypothetical protein
MKRIALAFGTVALGTMALGTVAIGLATSVYAQVPSPGSGNNPNQPGNSNVAPAQSGQLPPAGPAAGAVQVPPPPQPVPSLNRPSSRGYSLYGGPEDSRSQTPERRASQGMHFSPLYTTPGIPDEITTEDQAREARRDAAVEFGMYRRQFVGSTQFWMDHDRTRLANVRYAMDEAMFRSIHPDYDWGDGGYMYNTAASVGGPQLSGSSNRVIVTPPQATPTVRHGVQ